MAKSIYEGYANGHYKIRGYWTRQWTEINPDVEPIANNDGQNGTLEVIVHQKVEDLDDNMMDCKTHLHFTGRLITANGN
jgi:hypothetical protein